MAEDKTQYSHPDDRFLKIGKIVADVMLGLECGFFIVFGIIGCVNVSSLYVLWIFLGPAIAFAAWVFERAMLSLCHDVKMMRNKMGATEIFTPQFQAPAPAPVQTQAPAPEKKTIEPTEPTAKPDKVFCMNCGTENGGEARFCRKCGNELKQ